MAKKGGGGELFVAIMVGAGIVGAVWYAQKNSKLKAEVDGMVAQLNARYGKGWVRLGEAALKAFILTTPLATAVKVFDAVYAAEQMAGLNGEGKLSVAINKLW